LEVHTGERTHAGSQHPGSATACSNNWDSDQKTPTPGHSVRPQQPGATGDCEQQQQEPETSARGSNMDQHVSQIYLYSDLQHRPATGHSDQRRQRPATASNLHSAREGSSDRNW